MRRRKPAHPRHENRARLVASGAVVFLAVLAFLMIRVIPPQHIPIAKLDLERPIGLATPMQFARVTRDAGACATALRESRIEVEPLADTREGACGFTDAVALVRTNIPYSTSPVEVSCPLAAALYVWEREVVAPASEWLESPVARIEVLGAFSCRRIYGRATGRMSEHATGNAIDISGFRLENGRVVSVEEAWSAGGRDAAFLRQVRTGGCRTFQVVLSPDYNLAHHDHLHFDMAPYKLCS